ncbi:hypothetical protein Q9R20_12395 [Microbacterium sp. PRF11]|uniref:hypothetical protein n=1 Tax=Microbacterium sp. PRF11 TaxID=2962593 RepID=UPI0028826FAD|nr:hypothetical protein [Microbacterium sp. PRF11]MDT0117786.1 hypothetical protein [Microbacterium sp. PRF11]
MNAGRPVGPTLEELRADLIAELQRHPLLTRGAVVMRSDLATALGVDAETVEQLTTHTLAAGYLAAATWITPTDGEDAALVALLASTDARLVPG